MNIKLVINILIVVICNIFALGTIQTLYFFNVGAGILNETIQSIAFKLLDDFITFYIMTNNKQTSRFNVTERDLENLKYTLNEYKDEQKKENDKLFYKCIYFLLILIIVLLILFVITTQTYKTSILFLIANLIFAFIGFTSEIVFFNEVVAKYKHVTKLEMINKISDKFIKSNNNKIKYLCDKNKNT